MPDSVKISELNSRTALATDVVPAVDGTFSQTVRVTAASIAQIGGGPPGDNTVTTAKMANSAVTAAKCSFTGPDVIFSKTEPGAGSGVEIPCTPFARQLLAAPTNVVAKDVLQTIQSSSSPVFTGIVQVSRGSITTNSATPAIAPAADPTTGIVFPASDAMSIVSSNSEIWRFQSDGSFMSKAPEDNLLRLRYAAVAWAQFDALSTAGTNFDISRNQHAIAARYGLTQPGAPSAILGIGGATNDADAGQRTRDYLFTLEQSRGIILDYPQSPAVANFADKYGKINPTTNTNSWPDYARGTEQRANFYSPGDDKLWYRTAAGAWALTPATGKGWIGTIKLSQPAGTSPLIEARGIVRVQRDNQGRYTLFFPNEAPMPDTNYCVLVSTSEIAVARVFDLTTGSFKISLHANGGATSWIDPRQVFVTVFR